MEARVPVLLVLLMAATACQGCQEVSAPECSAQSGELATYHAHQSSCSLYYRCQGGQRDVFSCAHGHHFDTQLQRCHLADNVPCDTCQTPDINLKQKSAVATAACPPTPTCQLFEWGMKKPYPPDCNKYILCDAYANNVINKCAVGTEFSPTALICTSPSTAMCPVCQSHELTTTFVFTTPNVINTTPITIPADLTTAKEETTTISNELTTIILLTTVGICSEMKICIPELDWGESYPYPQDCSKYIYCNRQGLGIITNCPAGKHYSEELYECTIPEEANCPLCILSTTPEPTTTEQVIITTEPSCPEIPTCGPSLDVELKSYPPDCTQYIHCSYDSVNEEHITDIRKCVSRNPHFSPTLNKCQTIELAMCTECISDTTTPEIITQTVIQTTSVKSTTQEPTTVQPTSTEKTTVEITTLEPTTVEPTTVEPTTVEPTTVEPTTVEPTTVEPTTVEPTTVEPTTLTTQPELTTQPTEMSNTNTPELTTPTIPICPPTPTCTFFESGVNKPYPPDCKKYTYCVLGGSALTRNCLNAGEHFSPTANICMPAAEAGCPYCIVTPL